MTEASTKVPDIADAIALAAKHHAGMVDKGGAPYILHPIRVMSTMTTDEARRVAVLHDVMEDTTLTADELRMLGYPGHEVAALEALTRKKGETYEAFIDRVAANPLARVVKRADLVDNMDVRRLPQVGFEEAARLAKYLRGWKRLGDDVVSPAGEITQEGKRSRSVRLVKTKGPEAVCVDARIDGDGDLVIAGEDISDPPMELFGDRDYEYSFTVRSQHKDDLLLALIAKSYTGDPMADIALHKLLEEKSIPFEFSNYLSAGG